MEGSSEMPRRKSSVLQREDSFDSSDDLLDLMRALEEEQDTKAVDQSPVEIDQEFPNRPFEMSAAAQKKLDEFASEDHINKEEDDGDMMPLASALKMDANKSVRFLGPFEVEENGRLREFRTPSPESLLYMQALENPMSHTSIFEKEYEDLVDTPAVSPSGGGIPPYSPPAYTSGDEGSKTPPKSSVASELLSQDKKNSASQDAIGRYSDSDSEEEDVDDEDYSTDQLEVFSYIDKFRPESIDLAPKLQAFALEYQPAYGEPDLFVKIPRPDEIDDNAGLSFFDEPPPKQTDAAVVQMQIKNAAKDSTVLDDEVPVKQLTDADNKSDQIKDWIAQMKAHQKQKPSTDVSLPKGMPSVEQLMQETPRQLQHMRAIPAELDVSLEQYVDMNLNLLDIPIPPDGNRIKAVYQLFATLMEFQKSAHFRHLAANQGGEGGASTSTKTERLEL